MRHQTMTVTDSFSTLTRMVTERLSVSSLTHHEGGASGPRRGWRIIIDGMSGTGKTTLAHRLADALSTAPDDLAPCDDTPACANTPRIELIELDDFYPGWDGLAAASQITQHILVATDPGYRRWDWAHERPGTYRHLDRYAHWIIDGCGALTPASAASADVTIWVDGPTSLRYRRAIGRDGALFEPYWDAWEEQTRAHIRAHRPDKLADIHLTVTADAMTPVLQHH